MFDLYELDRYGDKVEIIVHDHPTKRDVMVLRLFFTSLMLSPSNPALFKNYTFPTFVAQNIIEKARKRGVRVRPLGIRFLLKEIELDVNEEKEVLHVACKLFN